MADQIHMALASFRDEILTSTARLEFQLRDMTQRINTNYTSACYASPSVNPNATPNCMRNDRFWADDRSTESDVLSSGRQDALESRIRILEASIQMLLANQRTVDSNASSVTTTIEHDLLSMQAPENTRNIIVKSHCSTPALAAAVTAANTAQPPDLTLPVVAATVVAAHTGIVEADEEEEADEVVTDDEADAEADADAEAEAEDTHEVVEEEAEVEEEEDAPTLTRMVLNNQVYFLDEENTAYQETEDGYEEVGVFNPITKRVEVTVEEEVEEEDNAEEEEAGEEEQEDAEEEEAIEVEEFIFKGQTYARDAENNVYLDGEQVGTWNGKKIVPMT